MNGTTNCDTKLMWPLACDTIVGANPHHRPPTYAAARLRTRCRESTKYQAAAVPASPSVSSSTIDTPTPKKCVIGATGRLRASTDVLAIMFTPSGTLIRVLKNGLSPWNITRSPCPTRNMKTPWSSSLADSTRPFGSIHNWMSTTTASAR